MYIGDDITDLTATSVTNILGGTFVNCTNLVSVTIPNIKRLGSDTFAGCSKLGPSLYLNGLVWSGGDIFYKCFALRSVYFSGDKPTDYQGGFYIDLPDNQVTNYVTNPTAIGWGPTFGDMPVVRKDIYSKSILIDGSPAVNALSATNLIESLRDFHVDSYTNVIWKSVYSNGWMRLVAYTNYPAN
jgi:hypothetical protein